MKIFTLIKPANSLSTFSIKSLIFFNFFSGGIYSSVILYALQQDAGFENVFQKTSIPILGFVVLQFLYFIIIRISYIKNLKNYVYR